jgi:diguanylate cyclase (GGDEF)-like protein/PAS domain S-box-containing protein
MKGWLTMAAAQLAVAFIEDDDDQGLVAALQTQQALIDTQERLGMMLDVMPMGLLIHTEQGILFANQEACGMLQVGKADIIGRHFLDYLTPNEFEAVHSHFAGSFQMNGAICKLETTIVRRDGALININLLTCRLPWQGTPVVQVLLQDVTDLKHKEEQLRRMATLDALTGACNRRHLFDVGGTWLEHAGDADFTLSVISLDVDHFKKINDTHGHAVGDLALKVLVRVTQEILDEAHLAEQCLLARLGGEEFLLLLPRLTLADAVALADRIRAALELVRLDGSKKQFGFTASFGVACFEAADFGLDGLLSRADVALYAAKHAGRNCVRVAA